LGHALAVNRIAIVGPVASGKTTLATCLGSRLRLPVADLDDYYWRQFPLPTDEEWVAKHSELISGDRWIISGDYRAVANSRFHAADAVVWLDLPRPMLLYRVTLRKLKGHPAPLGDSWRWILRYANHGRHDTATALANPQLNCSIYRLRSSKDVTSFLNQVEN
jgi:nicotinamide riboside kinase